MFNPATLPDVALNQVAGGVMGAAEVAEMRKALEAGYGTDVATLTGGGAMRLQSLEKTMLATIQDNKHFALFNSLAKSNATATVDEWTEQSSIGGFLGGSTNTETGDIRAAMGDYARRTGQVKYLMTRREVSFVQSTANNMVEAQAVEAANGAKQLLTDAEFLSFEGDSTVVPTEFDGLTFQLESLNSVDHVIDMEGEPLHDIAPIDRASSVIASLDNFGTPTDLFMSPLVQSDFNTKLDPAYRVSLSGSPQELMIGAPVKGINTTWGNIATRPDVFVLDEQKRVPFELLNAKTAVANAAFKPAGLAVAVSGSGGAQSKWKAAHGGNYYYAVAGVNAKGQTQAVVSSQVAVVAGGKATLTITKSASGEETGYAIYRGRKDGTNALSDLRLVRRIPASGNDTTVWVDLNLDIPGSTKAYLLNMSPGDMAITWRQMLPMTRFNLYPTVSAVIPWAQMLFGYLRLGKRRQHVCLKNIVPLGARWKPF